MSTACETVKDLIPLYIDGTCSDSTDKFVKNHLNQCKKCRDYCNMCRHSKDTAEKRSKTNSGDKDFIFAPDDGYELIARRVEKSILAERVAIISAAVAAIVTTIIIFMFRSRKDK